MKRIKRYSQRPIYRHVIYLFCEGKTEDDYLRKLIRKEGLESTIRLILVRRIATPNKLMAEAIRWTKNAGLTKKESVWIVFDDDEKGDVVVDAFNLYHASTSARIRIAFMKPCIELWALMHFKKDSVSTHADAQTKLESLMPGYDHDKFPYFDIERMQEYGWAVQRARDWENSLEGALPCNASRYAGIYRLTEEIRSFR